MRSVKELEAYITEQQTAKEEAIVGRTKYDRLARQAEKNIAAAKEEMIEAFKAGAAQTGKR